MSDNPTQETPDSRSFEERVFARFDALDARMDRFESRIEGKVDALDARLSSLEGKVDELNGRVTVVEEKVDSRMRETRPIWEGVLARLDNIEKELKSLSRGVMLLHEDNFHIRTEQRELRERVEKLESQSTR
jgi:chromosome segregation ATPase